MSQIYVALDIETTGLDVERDAITEIGIVKFRDQEVISTWSSLVNPRRHIPYKIQRLTGITPEKVKDAPTISALLPHLAEFVGSAPIIGHNVPFDLGFLRQQRLFVQNAGIDTFELASILVPEAPRYSLTVLAETLGIEMENAHRALPDAIATKDIFLVLMERARNMDIQVLREINRLARKSDWSLKGIFLQVEKERARTAFVGDSIRQQLVSKGRLAESAMGLVLGQVERETPLEPTSEALPVDGEELAAMISPGGLFGRRFPGYEHRPQQVEMLCEVVEAFNRKENLMVEADTGTGKSMAYLLPAIYFAIRNGRTVVISTNTINLQDQLYTKDIPDLQDILPIKFKAALLKGRSNYICLRRLAGFRRAASLQGDEVRFLAKVLTWLPTTKTGDRSELILVREDFQTWKRVQSEAETCLGERCRHQQQGECFLYRARRRAAAAHLVVVNHALLLSDMTVGNRLLPEYKYLIIDEAHHLEARATDQLGFSVEQRRLQYLFASLSRPLGRDRTAGVVSDIKTFVDSISVSETSRRKIEDVLERISIEVDRSQRALENLFSALQAFVDEHTEEHTRNRGSSHDNKSSYDFHLRITPGMRSQPGWDDVEMRWDGLSAPMLSINKELEKLLRGFRALDEYNFEGYNELVREMMARVQQLLENWEHANTFLVEPTEQAIYWLTISASTGDVILKAVPLHVGPLLNEGLYSDKDSVIFTSATLRIGDDFEYMRQRLGLEGVVELSVGSPFDYLKSTLLYIPTDIPEPGKPHYQKMVERALIDLCRATQGQALLLFTSYSQLRATYRAMSKELENDGIILYGQSLDGSRRQLLENFKATPKAVLLGTRSFWEGVDVVGSALSCLVIARLPFSVPSDPVFAARAETFEDPFSQYAVPETILRFRQGFGRLIRSKDDRGVVVVLDRRIITKSYGPEFIRSLPECTVHKGTLANLPAMAARWIRGGEDAYSPDGNGDGGEDLAQ
ncbi:MAG: DEAD/DEAH box helicase family protein [Anaerolineae bacterium]|nr:DEAD/DEAH box helicase family protein [Anaerolineae bacterium]